MPLSSPSEPPSGSPYTDFFMDSTFMDSLMLQNAAPVGSKGAHPTFSALTLLVLGAVMEVVFVSLPGYIIAKCGMMDPEFQKFLANLNVMLFTPCLSTSALLSNANADPSSLRETGLPIDPGQTARAWNNTRHIPSADLRLVAVRHHRLKGIPIQEAP